MLEDVVYLQVWRPDQTWFNWQSRPLRVARTTLRKPDPDSVSPGCIVIAVRLKIPSEAFEPISPEVTVEVPLELVERIRTAEAEAVRL